MEQTDRSVYGGMVKRDDNSRDPDLTRGRILDAALDTFASKGYHNTRMDEIVSGSGTSKGAIYFHFPNKERLFLALVDQFANLLERQVRAAVEDEERGMLKVEAGLAACLQTFGKYRRPAKLLLVQAVGLGSSFEQKRLEVNDRFTDLIRGWLDEAIAAGDVEPVDSDVVACAWMGAIYAVVIRWVYTGEPEPERILSSLLPVLLKSVGHDPCGAG